MKKGGGVADAEAAVLVGVNEAVVAVEFCAGSEVWAGVGVRAGVPARRVGEKVRVSVTVVDGSKVVTVMGGAAVDVIESIVAEAVFAGGAGVSVGSSVGGGEGIAAIRVAAVDCRPSGKLQASAVRRKMQTSSRVRFMGQSLA